MKEEKKDWIQENRYRKMILEILQKGEKTREQIEQEIKITLLPYLANYKPQVSLKISPFTLQNHLNLLEREGLIQKKEDKNYRLNFSQEGPKDVDFLPR